MAEAGSIQVAVLDEAQIRAWEQHAQLAWAAGIFEGEGCLIHNVARRPWIAARGRPKTHHNHLQLTVRMTDLDTIQKFRDAVGVGTVATRPQKTSMCKDLWTWRCGERAGMRLIAEFWPLLSERRRERFAGILEAKTRWRENEYDSISDVSEAS